MKSKSALYSLLFFALCFFATTAQSYLQDSIKINSYISKTQFFTEVNADSSLYYSTAAYQLAKNTSNNFLKCRATLNLGYVYQNISDYRKGTLYFKESIALAEKGNFKQLQAQAYNGFANMFAIQNQFTQAAEYFNKALDISKEINDLRKVSVILMNLGNIEYNFACLNGDFSKANKAYSQAYDWAVTAKDTGQIITCLGNWGLSYSDEGKLDLSLDKLNKGMELAIAVNNTTDLIFLKYYLGRTYGLMKEYQKAKESFKGSLALSVQFKEAEYESENYYCLAKTNYETENYKDAYDYFFKYKSLQDTLSGKEVINELNTIKTKYDTEKKQKEIELLKVNANKNKIVNISLIAGAVLLFLLVILILNRYRLKEKTNQLLASQNQIISEKNKDISDSINYAKKIQDAILPSSDDIHKVFPESFVLSLPKDVVSGDFYWFTQYQHLKLFVVADCTGHGVPGALMSMIGNTLLNSIVNERRILKPDIILNELRKEIISVLKQGENSSNKDGMDISLICFNTQTQTLEVACANN
ncbi:MAG: tetratricopeptide repeat protein, partial [Bacteroidota bacterium]